jgi:hypothetical protein
LKDIVEGGVCASLCGDCVAAIRESV